MSHPALRLIPEKGCPTSNRYLLSKRVEVYGALDKKITEVVNVDTLVVYRLAYRNGLNIEVRTPINPPEGLKLPLRTVFDDLH